MGLIFPENVRTIEANTEVDFADIEPPDLDFLKDAPDGEGWIRKLGERLNLLMGVSFQATMKTLFFKCQQLGGIGLNPNINDGEEGIYINS